MPGKVGITFCCLLVVLRFQHLTSGFECDRIQKAVLEVINGGSSELRTPDIGGSGTTTGFTDAVIARL